MYRKGLGPSNLSGLDENRDYTFLPQTMGLKYPLKKFDSQWPFPMGIWNDFITIFGKDCHIWNKAPRSLLSNVT